MKKMVVFSLIFGLLGSFHHGFAAEVGEQTQAEIRMQIDNLIDTAINQVDAMVPLIDSTPGSDFQLMPASADLLSNLSRSLNQITELSKRLKDRDYQSIAAEPLLRLRDELWERTMRLDTQEEKANARATLENIRNILRAPTQRRETRKAIQESEVGGTAPHELIDLITEFTT